MDKIMKNKSSLGPVALQVTKQVQTKFDDVI